MDITQLFTIQYPIIQAPMLGVTSPAMVAAVSNNGGLGSLPVGGLSPEKTRQLIQETKSLTGKPFAVNLFAHDLQPVNRNKALAMQEYLTQLGSKYGLTFDSPDPDTFTFYTYKDLIDILIAEEIKIVSFTFGILSNETISKLKAHGVVLIGTATSVKEAVLLEQAGVDAITAQGIEAGGHRGSFTHPLPQVGLMALLPQMADAVAVPILASGAINDSRTIKAAFSLGASGVQIGTPFIASHESLAIPSYKNRLLFAADTDTQLTNTFSGRWARGITNAFIKETENENIAIPPYPVQNSLTGALRTKAQQTDNNEMTNMWAGQSVSGLKKLSAAEIFKSLVNSLQNI